MGIIARVFPGRASALLAGHLILGRRAQGLAVACVIGIAGVHSRLDACHLFHMAASETAKPSYQLTLGILCRTTKSPEEPPTFVGLADFLIVIIVLIVMFLRGADHAKVPSTSRQANLVVR